MSDRKNIAVDSCSDNEDSEAREAYRIYLEKRNATKLKKKQQRHKQQASAALAEAEEEEEAPQELELAPERLITTAVEDEPQAEQADMEVDEPDALKKLMAAKKPTEKKKRKKDADDGAEKQAPKNKKTKKATPASDLPLPPKAQGAPAYGALVRTAYENPTLAVKDWKALLAAYCSDRAHVAALLAYAAANIVVADRTKLQYFVVRLARERRMASRVSAKTRDFDKNDTRTDYTNSVKKAALGLYPAEVKMSAAEKILHAASVGDYLRDDYLRCVRLSDVLEHVPEGADQMHIYAMLFWPKGKPAGQLRSRLPNKEDYKHVFSARLVYALLQGGHVTSLDVDGLSALDAGFVGRTIAEKRNFPAIKELGQHVLAGDARACEAWFESELGVAVEPIVLTANDVAKKHNSVDNAKLNNTLCLKYVVDGDSTLTTPAKAARLSKKTTAGGQMSGNAIMKSIMTQTKIEIATPATKSKSGKRKFGDMLGVHTMSSAVADDEAHGHMPLTLARNIPQFIYVLPEGEEQDPKYEALRETYEFGKSLIKKTYPTNDEILKGINVATQETKTSVPTKSSAAINSKKRADGGADDEDADDEDDDGEAEIGTKKQISKAQLHSVSARRPAVSKYMLTSGPVQNDKNLEYLRDMIALARTVNPDNFIASFDELGSIIDKLLDVERPLEIEVVSKLLMSRFNYSAALAYVIEQRVDSLPSTNTLQEYFAELGKSKNHIQFMGHVIALRTLITHVVTLTLGECPPGGVEKLRDIRRICAKHTFNVFTAPIV